MKNFTEGSIARKLGWFALPILLANLLQASMLLATVLTTFLSPLFIAVMGLDVAGAAYAIVL